MRERKSVGAGGRALTSAILASRFREREVVISCQVKKTAAVVWLWWGKGTGKKKRGSVLSTLSCNSDPGELLGHPITDGALARIACAKRLVPPR